MPEQQSEQQLGQGVRARRRPLSPEPKAARRSLGRLAGPGLGEASRGIGEIHGAVAGRVFVGLRRAGLGPAVAPVRLLHDGISDGVYAAVRHGNRAGAVAVGEVSTHVGERVAAQEAGGEVSGARSDLGLAGDARATTLVGFLNGAWGDHLDANDDPLAWQTTVRHEGADVPVRTCALAEAYPAGRRRLAVFLPGLLETERSGRWPAGATGTTRPPPTAAGSPPRQTSSPSTCATTTG